MCKQVDTWRSLGRVRGVKVASYIFDFFATCRPPPGSGCRQRPPPTVLREKKNQKCPPDLSVRKKSSLSQIFTVHSAPLPLDAFANIIFSSVLLYDLLWRRLGPTFWNDVQLIIFYQPWKHVFLDFSFEVKNVPPRILRHLTINYKSLLALDSQVTSLNELYFM
jgi:hypothetical protein